MIKNILPFAAIAIMVFFGACSKEEVPEIEPEETVRTITLTALMPEDDPATRVSLTQDGLNIKLKWEVGDPIKLMFDQAGVASPQVNTALVESISADGKTAYFTIVMPGGGIDATKAFDLYGVYGGGTLSNQQNQNSEIYFPQGSPKRVTLAEIKTQRDVMLHFKYEFTDAFAQNISVSFKHFGSLFAIHLKNTATTGNTLSGFDEVRLIGPDGAAAWGYNAGNTQGRYFLQKEQFNFSVGLTNYINFAKTPQGLSDGQRTTIWAWYPIPPNIIWPVLRLQLMRWSGTGIIPNATSAPHFNGAKTPVAGNTYHFYAEWDGTELNFVSRAEYEGPGGVQ